MKRGKNPDSLVKDTIGYGLGGLGLNIGVAGLTTYLTFFYTDYMLLPAASVSLIMMVTKIIDAVTDVLVGMLIDRTNTRFGKVRPWLLWFTVPGCVFVAAMFYVPTWMETSGRIWYAFITYNLVSFFYQTCVTLPMAALVTVLTPDPAKRLKLNKVHGFANSFAGFLINFFAAKIMGLFGGGATGFFWYFVTAASVGAVLMMACFFLTKERLDYVRPKEKISVKEGVTSLVKNPYGFWFLLLEVSACANVATLGAATYYCLYCMDGQTEAGVLISLTWVAIAAATIVLPPFIKPNRKGLSCALTYFFAAAVGIIYLLIPNPSLILLYIMVFLRGIGAGPYYSVSGALMSDVIDYGEWKTGTRIEGLLNSCRTFGKKLGAAVGGALVAAVLAAGGYVGGAAEQTETALTAIRVVYLVIPAAISTLNGICFMMISRVEKQADSIREDLRNNRLADGSARKNVAVAE